MDKESTLIFGLSYLSEEEMRTLLFKIASYDTENDIENAINFSTDCRLFINNAILEKLRKVKSEILTQH